MAEELFVQAVASYSTDKYLWCLPGGLGKSCGMSHRMSNSGCANGQPRAVFGAAAAEITHASKQLDVWCMRCVLSRSTPVYTLYFEHGLEPDVDSTDASLTTAPW